MSNRIWFHASEGQQKGPFPEAQFRDLIARGIVRSDTLVWAEGMTGWQKAGAVPGLVPGASPAVASSGDARGRLSVDLPLWPFLGWCILLVVGNAVVVPAPWIATVYYRWLFPRVHVPQRPNIGFTGQVGDIWYVFVALALAGYVGLVHDLFQLATIPLQAFLSWMVMRWVVANLSSNGQPIPMTFDGSPWAFIGWQLLMFLAMFTIIGWAWVMAAWMRWICRNIVGTRREVIFVATGLQLLWRTLAFGFGCLLIIPIPWLLRWYFTWTMTQFELVERRTAAA
ncbi:hypothetical protein XI03_31975 [Bradyrhizobium sp. CCBAU 65884]|uniref:DUF4339 domain-containing protein n=1 Tax=Bradyrhizobium sp. CCBAU 65884 TaxID=722477 RepID=UPI0023054D68|nr:DUF4339 domain-containing protein [Bradyrhizobium sp. CCBAU 65884]MDA9479025.1 hypothetical protein [Bradyrhizobium sp. CCBAU 65884]